VFQDQVVLEERLTVFPETKRRTNSIEPTPAQRQRSQSVSVFESNQIKDPALWLFWNGELEQAEKAFEINKNTDQLAYVRWAQLHFMRFWFTEDKDILEQTLQRFIFAEKACMVVALDLKSKIGKQTAPTTPKRRLSLVKSEAPGMMRPSSLEMGTRDVLDQWKELQGLIALCLVFQGICYFHKNALIKATMVMLKAWTVCRDASNNIESKNDIPNTLKLVTAGFNLGFSISSQNMLKVFNVDGESFHVRGHDELEKLIANTDKEGETHNYATLLLALYYLYLSNETYRVDRMTQVKRANTLVDPVCKQHPEWVMFAWTKSQIERRMGRMDDAIATLHRIWIQIQGELSSYSNRLSLDMANMYLVQGDCLKCEELLSNLLAEESEDFLNRDQAYIMCAASCAFRTNYEESDAWLVKNHSKIWKSNILSLRVNKTLIYYELCYHFGLMSWFDSSITDTLTLGGGSKWLDDANKVLSQMSIDVVEKKQEWLVVKFLIGVICSFKDDLDRARTMFESVLEHIRAKIVDPWMFSYAVYELAIVDLKQANMLQAVKHLNICINLRLTHSYNERIKLRAFDALRYIKSGNLQGDVKWMGQKDELGLFVGESSVPIETLKQTIVHRGSKFEEARKMSIGDYVTWIWAVASHSIKFEVVFVTSNEVVVIEEAQMVETHDFKEGFFTATQNGIVKFKWDNSGSRFTSRRIQYNIQ